MNIHQGFVSEAVFSNVDAKKDISPQLGLDWEDLAVKVGCSGCHIFLLASEDQPEAS